MPGEAEMAMVAWQLFQANAANALTSCSFVVRMDGGMVGNNGGPCTVAGADHSATITAPAARVSLVLRYAPNTHVHKLTTTLGGNGSVFWFPYVHQGVGYCDMRYQVPVGTIALTDPMNGCSLRVYANRLAGTVRFCHDANGDYADDAAQRREGFDHVHSVNADAKTRGTPGQNTNNYWNYALQNPLLGYCFMSVKTGPSQWSVYKSVTRGTHVLSSTTNWLGRRREILTMTFNGAQSENGLVTVVNIPPIVPRGKTTDDLQTTPAPETRARSKSI